MQPHTCSAAGETTAINLCGCTLILYTYCPVSGGFISAAVDGDRSTIAVIPCCEQCIAQFKQNVAAAVWGSDGQVAILRKIHHLIRMHRGILRCGIG